VKAVRLIRGAVRDPDKEGMLILILEEAWSAIAGDYDLNAIESARLELATIMLALANNSKPDFEIVKASAIRLLRDDFEGFPLNPVLAPQISASAIIQSGAAAADASASAS
jgi:hypothetical protein